MEIFSVDVKQLIKKGPVQLLEVSSRPQTGLERAAAGSVGPFIYQVLERSKFRISATQFAEVLLQGVKVTDEVVSAAVADAAHRADLTLGQPVESPVAVVAGFDLVDDELHEQPEVDSRQKFLLLQHVRLENSFKGKQLHKFV